MTTNQIADIIIRHLSEKSFPIFLTTYSGRGFSEADVLGISKNGIVYEFEIKRSRADFLGEFKNKEYKHRKLANKDAIAIYNEWKKGRRTDNKIEFIQIPNRYYFVCQKGLIYTNELPEYCGLIYVSKPYNYIEIKQAPLLHHFKANEDMYRNIASTLSQRIIYGCSYYTFKQRKNETN
jgi:hypothetical protein